MGWWFLLLVGMEFIGGWRAVAGGIVLIALIQAMLLKGGGGGEHWIGPWAGLAVLPFLLAWRQRRFRFELLKVKARHQDLEERRGQRKEQRSRSEQEIRGREEEIHRISEQYGLSKRFLGTLDLNQALSITEDALLTWFPQIAAQERAATLDRVRSLVEENAISRDSLVEVLPSMSMDPGVREQWAVISGQLELGLQRICLYRRVEAAAIHDGLTGLLARRTFRERLKEEVARAQRRGGSLVFLMVDLDHFKRINDTYGHLVGDVVLREVANCIRRSVREVDLVARYGGEEFAVVLPEADRALGVQIADRIRQTIERAWIQAYDEKIQITVSIGVALFPESARGADALVERADSAMYEAKRLGRNRAEAA